MRSRVWKLVGCFLALQLCGCAFIGLKKQIQPLTDAATLSGQVVRDPQDQAPLAVMVLSEKDGREKIVRYKLMQRSGDFHFVVPPGTYSVAAFEDVNADFIYEPETEPAVRLKTPGKLVLAPKQNVSDLRVVFSKENFAPLGIPANLSVITPGPDATRQQLRIGKLISLDDPRFDDASGEMGLWKYDRFRKEIGGGVFFLEPYDPNKIPVLFVHGYTGTPRDFKLMIGRLDREKFQPWVAFYPSAARIPLIADNLNAAVTQLQMTYKFKKMYLVGYSMGGLVSRSMLMKNAAEHEGNYIPIFVSIATPWHGHYLADLRHLAPTEVPSWQDLATDSSFVTDLFSKPLPEGTTYYLFFGYKGDRNPVRQNNDKFITLESALDPRAQKDAARIYAFNDEHENILDNEEVSKRLAEIFEEEENPVFGFFKDVGEGVVGAGKDVGKGVWWAGKKIVVFPIDVLQKITPAGDKSQAASQ